jgi:hypothetical protein
MRAGKLKEAKVFVDQIFYQWARTVFLAHR